MQYSVWNERLLRWNNQVLFSLNLAWAVVWLERTANKYSGGHFLIHGRSILGSEAGQLVSPIGGATILDQLLWSIALGTLIFLLVRVAVRLAPNVDGLRVVAGLAGIAAFPRVAILSPFGFVDDRHRIEVYRGFLYLELFVALACGTLYYVGRYRLSPFAMIPILSLHFLTWTWVTSSYFSIQQFVTNLRASPYYAPWLRTFSSLALAIVFNWGFPVLGLLASLVWMGYLKRPPTAEV